MGNYKKSWSMKKKVNIIVKLLNGDNKSLDLIMMRKKIAQLPMEYHLPIDLILASNEWNQWLISFNLFRDWLKRKHEWLNKKHFDKTLNLQKKKEAIKIEN